MYKAGYSICYNITNIVNYKYTKNISSLLTPQLTKKTDQNRPVTFWIVKTTFGMCSLLWPPYSMNGRLPRTIKDGAVVTWWWWCGAVSHEQLEPGPGGEKVVPAGSSCLLRPFIAPYWQ